MTNTSALSQAILLQYYLKKRYFYYGFIQCAFIPILNYTDSHENFSTKRKVRVKFLRLRSTP